jgi:hypothetical protein
MAKSGSITVVVTKHDNMTFSWSEVSQSVANNTTTISWKLELITDAYGRINSSAEKAWSVTINGTTYSGENYIGVGNNTTKTLASGTTVIGHNADGSKSFSFSFSQEFAITFQEEYVGTKSGSGTGTLDTIPRASQPSLVTWPNTTQNVGDFGVEFSIHMNRASSSFTHTVRYEYGSRKGTIASNVGTGTTWAVPLTFMNDIPNATSGSGRIYVDTYNGSTLIGTKYTGFTATVPASAKPSCSLTLEDTTGIDDIYGSPVQGLSKIKITVNTTLAYSSPITSGTITADGASFNGLSATTGVLKASGSSKVTATVTDSRGRSGSGSYTMNVQAYKAPQVSSLTVHRADADGTENDQGDYIRVVFSAAISSMSSKNTARYVLRYKESTATTWTEVAISALNNVFTVTNREYIFAADESSSYDVEVIATDRHSSASRATSASTAFSLMDWHPSGTGIAFGKVSQKENTLEIGLDAEFLGKITGTIFDAILPVGSMVLRYDHIDPGTLYPGTTWARVYGAFPWFTDANGAIGTTGGERTVTLTVDQIPSHSHGSVYSQHAAGTKSQAWYTASGTALAYGAVATGGGAAHNNMPPYIQVSAWRRTA